MQLMTTFGTAVKSVAIANPGRRRDRGVASAAATTGAEPIRRHRRRRRRRSRPRRRHHQARPGRHRRPSPQRPGEPLGPPRAGSVAPPTPGMVGVAPWPPVADPCEAPVPPMPSRPPASPPAPLAAFPPPPPATSSRDASVAVEPAPTWDRVARDGPDIRGAASASALQVEHRVGGIGAAAVEPADVHERVAADLDVQHLAGRDRNGGGERRAVPPIRHRLLPGISSPSADRGDLRLRTPAGTTNCCSPPVYRKVVVSASAGETTISAISDINATAALTRWHFTIVTRPPGSEQGQGMAAALASRIVGASRRIDAAAGGAKSITALLADRRRTDVVHAPDHRRRAAACLGGRRAARRRRLLHDRHPAPDARRRLSGRGWTSVSVLAIPVGASPGRRSCLPGRRRRSRSSPSRPWRGRRRGARRARSGRRKPLCRSRR